MTSGLENLWVDRRYEDPELVQSNKWGRNYWRAIAVIRRVNIRKKNPLNSPAAWDSHHEQTTGAPSGRWLEPDFPELPSSSPAGELGSSHRPRGGPLWTESPHTPAHTLLHRLGTPLQVLCQSHLSHITSEQRVSNMALKCIPMQLVGIPTF